MRNAMIGLGVLVAVGCGSDGFNPSAPGSTRLNDLPPQDSSKLCIEALTFYQAKVSRAVELESACRGAGVTRVLSLPNQPTDAETRATCQAGYDACKTSPPPLVSDQSPADLCAAGAGDFGTCTATVDQYAACVTEVATTYATTIPPCSQLTTAKVLELIDDEGGPACQAIATVCPDSATSALMTSSALRLKK